MIEHNRPRVNVVCSAMMAVDPESPRRSLSTQSDAPNNHLQKLIIQTVIKKVHTNCHTECVEMLYFLYSDAEIFMTLYKSELMHGTYLETARL